MQLASLGWSDEVGAGRQGCCTALLYLHGLALEDGEVAGLRRTNQLHEVRVASFCGTASQDTGICCFKGVAACNGYGDPIDAS